ncbi:MAG: DNA primase [Clostridia bacterium]|nr:DNA primase [Clostridia bacterium]
MGGFYSQETIEDLKSQINIVDVVQRVLPLKKSGTNYMACCPFHGERTPSFVVSETKQIFTCFGCGAKGNVFGFVGKYYNIPFGQAVEKLAQEYGIELPKTSSPNSEKRQKFYDINNMAAIHYFKNFTQSKNPAYPYMKSRGIDDKTLAKFGIGYSKDNFDDLLKYMETQGVAEADLKTLSLIKTNSKGKVFDKFRNRVMFPLIDPSGRIVGFTARALGDEMPKYLNSDESLVFKKKNVLYGLNLTKNNISECGYSILVEGQMDVIGLYQNGVCNATASSGTSLTEEQARVLKRFAKKVVICYDADDAGRKAALRAIDILRKEGLEVKVCHVSDGKDPDEFVKKNGKEAFLEIIDKAIPGAEYKLYCAGLKYNLKSDDDKLKYMSDAIAILKGFSPIEADIYIKKLAKDLGLSEGYIRSEYEGTHIKAERSYLARKTEDKDTLDSIEKNLLALVFKDHSYLNRIAELDEMIMADFSRKVFSIAMDKLEANGSYELKDFEEDLEAEEFAKLKGIIDEIKLGAKLEEVYNESIKAWAIKQIKDQEESLKKLMASADADNDQERINSLMMKFEEIQMKKKKWNI